MGSIAQTVKSILGESLVISWENLAAPLNQAVQATITSDHLPVCIAYPETPAQLAAIVACAHQNHWRILPCGQGSKLSWGGLINGADLIVSTQRLSRLVEHAVGDLTVTVEAGLSFVELQRTLLKTRQFLAIDPAYGEQATLGGIVATRDTHALRQGYGGVRDMLIGVSFVRYDGQLATAGGRVVKNVAGYDLMKLMTGSFGTLGILTQLTFRTYPLREVSRTVVLAGNAEAIQVLTAEIRLSSLTPVAIDILSPKLLPECETEHYGLALQFQSIEAGVAEQVDRLQVIAKPHGVTSRVLAGDTDAQFWQALNATLFPAKQDSVDMAVIAKVGIRPAEGMALLTYLQTTLAPGTWQARLHANSGIGTLRLMAGDNSSERLQAVRSHCQRSGGYLNLLEAPTAWKMDLDPWALTDSVKLLMTQLKDQFDPQRCLSPGRFY